MFGREWGLMTLEFTYLVMDDTVDDSVVLISSFLMVSWGKFVEFCRISNFSEFAGLIHFFMRSTASNWVYALSRDIWAWAMR